MSWQEEAIEALRFLSPPEEWTIDAEALIAALEAAP